jgi:hypothetical protein
VFGLLLVALANRTALSTSHSVAWDARDETWFFFRWFGSAIRAGHFGDYFPFVSGGYPVNASIVDGGYNPVYLLFATLFVDSVWSINLVYLLYQLTAFSLSFSIGRSLALNAAGAWLLGLSVTASGYFVGHASHFSYLSNGVTALGLFLSLRHAAQGRSARSFAGALVWSFHACTTGSPEGLVFNATVLSAAGCAHLVGSSRRRSLLTGCAAGVLAGLLLASPALYHFANQAARSTRGQGLSVAQSLSGSLPANSLVNLLDPLLRAPGGPDGVDPTMDRFHLLFVSPVLLLAGVATWRKQPRLFWGALSLAALFTLLALGRHSPVPIRAWLAEHVSSYRIGRFPSGQHRGFALFCLALASALPFARWFETRHRDRYRVLGIALVSLDFLLVMGVNAWARYDWLDSGSYSRLPRFKVEFRGAEAALVNRARSCPPSRLVGAVDQLASPPDRFTWSGYTIMASATYLGERKSMRWALCGPSRLWQYASQRPQDHHLVYYGPERILLTTAVPSEPRDRLLLWSDVDDGFWALWVNGRRRESVRLPADLRGIDLSADDGGAQVEIEMRYLGPLSWIWRRPRVR